MIEAYALTGPLMRASNIKKDLRLLGYEYYSTVTFDVVSGVKGDSLDRYLIRMNECLEAHKIMKQSIDFMKLFIIYFKKNYKIEKSIKIIALFLFYF